MVEPESFDTQNMQKYLMTEFGFNPFADDSISNMIPNWHCVKYDLSVSSVSSVSKTILLC